MSGTRYVPRTEQEVRDHLEAAGFREVKIGGTRELVFEHPTPNKKVRIRVYSSVVPNGGKNTGTARGVGEDAGRVVLVASGSNRPVWKSKRIHRTKNFLENLLERCREAYRAVGLLVRCPACGEYMVERKARNGKKFLGCLKYPACKGTRNL